MRFHVENGGGNGQMYYNYYEDVIDTVLHNSQINYLAFPLTKFHAVGVKASIMYLSERNIELYGNIYIGTHVVTGRHIEVNYFNDVIHTNEINISYGVNEFRHKKGFLQKSKKFITNNRRLDNSRRTIYLVSVDPLYDLAVELYSLNIQCVFICIDDGTATYSNPYKLSLYYSYFFERKKLLLNIVNKYKSLLSTYLSLKTKKKYEKNKKLINFHLFYRRKRFLEKNTEVEKYYLKAFNLNSNQMNNTVYKKSVLFNTQCLVESGLTDGIVDLELYKKAINIVQKYDKNIVVKTHPREIDCSKYDNLGVMVLTESYCTQEDILASLQKDDLPKCIISISSSTLLNAIGIFGIPAISLSKILLREKNSKVMIDDTNNYVRMLEGAILFPNDFAEFEDLIQKYCL